VFLAGSVLAGIATHAWMLLAGRISQGLGAAAFVPSSPFLTCLAFVVPALILIAAPALGYHRRAPL
jgi:MFS family permease